MRDIKFNVIVGGEFVPVIKLGWDNGDLLAFTSEFRFTRNPKSLSQYTGVKDSNGVEIYENHIINETEHGSTIRKFIVTDIRSFTREFDNANHSAVWEVVGINLEMFKDK